MSRGNALLDRVIEVCPGFVDHVRIEQLGRGTVVDAAVDVVFPVSAVISTMVVGSDGDAAELALVGRKGFAGGVAADLPPASVGAAAHVTIGGSAWCGPTAALSLAAVDQPLVTTLLGEFLDVSRSEIARRALCNLHHSVEQRICRWLLTAGDRLDDDHFVMTQADLAARLGVRRASVNVVARNLQSTGAIGYANGNVRLVDRDALSARSCGCYGDLVPAYEQLGATDV